MAKRVIVLFWLPLLLWTTVVRAKAWSRRGPRDAILFPNSWRGGGETTVATVTKQDDDVDRTKRLLGDINRYFTDENLADELPLLVPKEWKDVEDAMSDFTTATSRRQFANPSQLEDRGAVAWKFFRGLAESDTFVTEFWHQRPLLIRGTEMPTPTPWVEGAFTLEDDLKDGVDNSYISGHKTADILRNGTKTDTWLLEPLRSVTPMQESSRNSSTSATTTWSDVQDALNGGTIYFNTAGSLWPSLGALCRLVMYAFGFPTNCNVYVTPPGCAVSVPPHTDRQDVFVLQTEGYKRWKVFAPPKRQPGGGRDPLDRGKQGDVLTLEELGPPLIDTVIGPGDVLYVPVGFPHTTDTLNTGDACQHSGGGEKVSVHLTMGLDTHVWMLTMAHLRWAVLQRCGLDFRINFENDDDYWRAIESLPIGFLARGLGSSSAVTSCWQATVESLQKGTGLTEEYLDHVANKLEHLLISLEPNRWKSDTHDAANGQTPLPSRQEMKDCISYMIDSHWRSLLNSQEELSRVDPNPTVKEEAIIKAFQATQNQDLIMEKFGIFCKSEPMAKMYAQRRMMAKSKTQGLY
jgi:Cupin superfamily protein